MRLIDADRLKKYMLDGLESMRDFMGTTGLKGFHDMEVVTKNFIRDIDDQPTFKPWIPFVLMEPTAEEKESNPEICFALDGEVPEDGQEILVSDGKDVWTDTFCNDDGVYLESDRDIEDGMAGSQNRKGEHRMKMTLMQCSKCNKWFNASDRRGMLICPGCGTKYYTRDWLEKHPNTPEGMKYRAMKGGSR